MHKIFRYLRVKLKDLLAQTQQEQLRECLVVDTSIDDLFEASPFLESQHVFQGVAVPSLVSERGEHYGYEVLLGVGVLLKRKDAVLVLQHHVQSNYHQLFKVRICDAWVEEVLGDKAT